MNMQNLMAQAKKIQGDMERITKEIDETVFSYKNENILLEINGKYEVIRIEILKSELLSDKEILEDMIHVAMNDVLGQIKKVKNEKLGKFTGGMGGLF